jgi:hypothetical protein
MALHTVCTYGTLLLTLSLRARLHQNHFLFDVKVVFVSTIPGSNVSATFRCTMMEMAPLWIPRRHPKAPRLVTSRPHPLSPLQIDTAAFDRMDLFLAGQSFWGRFELDVFLDAD